MISNNVIAKIKETWQKKKKFHIIEKSTPQITTTIISQINITLYY